VIGLPRTVASPKLLSGAIWIKDAERFVETAA
jgi:hypothetical protein